MARPTPYPMLAMIDATRSPQHRHFATDPAAAALERHARHLADELWPQQVFLTGNISRSQLDAVIVQLEAERLALHDGIRLRVSTQQAVKSQA